METLKLTDSYSWFGEFNFLKNKKGLFSGLLKYSPTNGVTLEALFTRPIVSNQIIHGIVQDIGKVTILVKNYQLQDIRNTAKSNFVRSETEISCYLLITGDHFPPKNLYFSSCSFRLNNLNRFCNPWNRSLPYSGSPLVNIKIDNKMNLELKTEAKGVFASNLITNNLIVNNKKLKHELEESFNKIKNKYPDEYITLKKEQNYHFYLNKLSKEIHLTQYLDEVYQIQMLFTFLTIEKTVPIEIKLINNSGKHKIFYPVLINLFIKQDELSHIFDEKPHRFHSFTLEDVPDFDQTYQKWQSFKLGHINLLKEALFAKINGNYDPLQLYVLLLAGIEQWISKEFGKPEQAADKFINTYSNHYLKELIIKNLPIKKEKENLGKLLMDMRSCIVHSHRSNGSDFSRFKPFVNYTSIGNLCEALFGCSLIAIYKNLNLDNKSLKSFESHIDRFISRYFSGD